MIEELVKETIGILEKNFYDKKFHFSYSSISKLLFSPAVFYQIYILNQKPEGKEKHLIEGSVIHCLLLEEHEFDNRYIVSPTNLPKDSAKLVIDTVYKKNQRALQNDPDLDLESFEQSILDTLVSINLYQTLKLDSARLEKILTSDNISYFEFLKQKDNKELLDETTYNYCVAAVDIIKSTPGIEKLLGISVSPTDNVEVFNELYLECDLKDEKFGLKGFIDNLVINHDEKKVYINDFKTTGKSLDKFEESVEFWNYWMQSVVYTILVANNYPDLVKEEYEFEFCFVVCDKYFNVYPFVVTRKTAIEWFKRFNDVLKEVRYHYYSNRYELPMKFDQGLVKL